MTEAYTFCREPNCGEEGTVYVDWPGATQEQIEQWLRDDGCPQCGGDADGVPAPLLKLPRAWRRA